MLDVLAQIDIQKSLQCSQFLSIASTWWVLTDDATKSVYNVEVLEVRRCAHLTVYKVLEVWYGVGGPIQCQHKMKWSLMMNWLNTQCKKSDNFPQSLGLTHGWGSIDNSIQGCKFLKLSNTMLQTVDPRGSILSILWQAHHALYTHTHTCCILMSSRAPTRYNATDSRHKC